MKRPGVAILVLLAALASWTSAASVDWPAWRGPHGDGQSDEASAPTRWNGPTDQFVASLIYAQGVLFVTGGFPEPHMLGVDPRGRGDITDTNILWRTHKGVAYVPSPVAHGDWFFVVADNGIGSCFEAKTGKLMWKERFGRRHSASGVAAGGHVYFVDDDGETFVVKAGPTFELVSQNSLGEACFASPAVSRGQLFIRTASHLYCIGKPGKVEVAQ